MLCAQKVCCIYQFFANFNVSPGGKFVAIITSLFANKIRLSRGRKSSVEISTDWLSEWVVIFFHAKTFKFIPNLIANNHLSLTYFHTRDVCVRACMWKTDECWKSFLKRSHSTSMLFSVVRIYTVGKE